MGGRLALYLALRYPERCAGLFLESASPGLESAESGRRGALQMRRRRSAWNPEISRRFFGTGTASRSSRLWRGTRTCSIGPSRRGGATILASLHGLCGEWGRGASLRCGESWKVSPCPRSPSQESWMRSTPGSPRAWRASTRESNPLSSPERDTTCTPRPRRNSPPCSGVLWNGLSLALGEAEPVP